MRVVLLGPPGAGKGTMAKILSRRLEVPHISAGDILRANIQNKTDLGKKAVAYVDKGQLVPDQLVIEMMRERLRQRDASSGFILDGFPRTETQALAFDEMLKDESIKVDHILNFDASDAKIIERLSGRRTCSKCGEIYHLRNIPPKVEGICDLCGGELIQRKDDVAATVQKRLEVYRKETFPLIQYYEKKKILKNVPADLEIGELDPILQNLMA